jgi:predicted  nucleic acid-binding Zn-ribbon protein
LEAQTVDLNKDLVFKKAEMEELEREIAFQAKDLSSLRNRTNLSQQNWLKEKGELLEREAYVKSEFEEAKQAMHNWEVLAMEERSIREGLGVKVIDLEEQLSSLQDAFDKSNAERENQSVTIDGLQRALQEIQTGKTDTPFVM